MKAVVVYESMYGNTHLVAGAVAEGLRPYADVTVVPVGEADASVLADTDLLVVGGPTHAHGMSNASTRKAAVATAEKNADLEVDADAEGPGLRDWFASLGSLETRAAAFDTRLHLPAAFSGRASKGIARKLHQHGATLVAVPESFFVTKENHLEPHEEEHARTWGAEVGAAMKAHAAR